LNQFNKTEAAQSRIRPKQDKKKEKKKKKVVAK